MDKFKNELETLYDENVEEITEDGMNTVKSTAQDG